MHSLSCALLGISLYIRRLVHDSARGSFQNQPGLAIKASGFGDTCKVEYLVANPIETSCSLQLPVGEYFHTLVKHFTALGYKRGQTIRSAPYDWRLSPGMYPVVSRQLSLRPIQCMGKLLAESSGIKFAQLYLRNG